MVKNKCVVVSNYATSELDRVLNTMGEDGYSLVSTLIAKNKYGIDAMYLFFNKIQKEGR